MMIMETKQKRLLADNQVAFTLERLSNWLRIKNLLKIGILEKGKSKCNEYNKPIHPENKKSKIRKIKSQNIQKEKITSGTG